MDVDICSNISDSTSEGNSNFSSLSGLTGYEEELQNLKYFLKDANIIKLNDDASTNANHQSDGKILSSSKLYNKFETLLQSNAKLENEITMANTQIEKLLGTKNNDCNIKSVELLQEYGKVIYDNNKVKSELAQWIVEASNCKRELEELKIEIQTKTYSITGLKAKIVELYMEIQFLTHANLKLKNSNRDFINELHSYEKLEAWYKVELNQSRAQKFEAFKSISQLKTILTEKELLISNRSNALCKLKNLYEALQSTNDELNKKISEVDNFKPHGGCITNRTSLAMNELTIQSLTDELSSIKNVIKDQQFAFEQINKENLHLISQSTKFEIILNEKDILISNLENAKSELKNKLEIVTERLKDSQELILKLTNDNSHLTLALNSANQEKAEVQATIEDLRANFTKFINNYQRLKDEACESSKKYSQLEKVHQKLNATHNQLESKAQTSINCLQMKIEALDERQKNQLDLQNNKENCLMLEWVVSQLNAIQAFEENPIALKKINFHNFSDETRNHLIEITKAFNNLKWKISKLKAQRDLQQTDDYKVGNFLERIKKLRALCKAKDLEALEKQNRYDGNVSTLLKKVKEHMKGRNIAEKRCSYLEELQAYLYDELNSYKLKESDYQSIKNSCDNYNNLNIKLKLEIERLGQKIVILQSNQNKVPCLKCLDYDVLKNQVTSIESHLEACRNSIAEKQNEITNLQIQVENGLSMNANIKNEHNCFLMEIVGLKNQLQVSFNEIDRLKMEKPSEEQCRTLKEKFFLQRLCKDLRVALQSYKQKNEMLRQQLESSKESLRRPKLNDDYINDLLERSQLMNKTKPLSNLQSSLDLLKIEMLDLRKQVSDF